MYLKIKGRIKGTGKLNYVFKGTADETLQTVEAVKDTVMEFLSQTHEMDMETLKERRMVND